MSLGELPLVKVKKKPEHPADVDGALFEVSNVRIALAIQNDSRPLCRGSPDLGWTKSVFEGSFLMLVKVGILLTWRERKQEGELCFKACYLNSKPS